MRPKLERRGKSLKIGTIIKYKRLRGQPYQGKKEIGGTWKYNINKPGNYRVSVGKNVFFLLHYFAYLKYASACLNRISRIQPFYIIEGIIDSYFMFS